MTTFTTEDRIKATSHHYAILTRSAMFREVCNYIIEHNLPCEVHANRTRFWVPESILSDFLHTYGGHCDFVPADQDLVTGQPMYYYDNLLAGDATIGNDKGYTVSTHEKQEEFARKRNESKPD